MLKLSLDGRVLSVSLPVFLGPRQSAKDLARSSLQHKCFAGIFTTPAYQCFFKDALDPTDGGAWWAAVHGVAKSRTRLSDFTFTFPGEAGAGGRKRDAES